MSRRLRAWVAAVMVGGCGGEDPPAVDGGFDDAAEVDAPPDVAADVGLDAARDAVADGARDATVDATRDAPGDAARDAADVVDAPRVLPSTPDRLMVTEVNWNPASVAVGTVAAVAESGSTRSFFGSLGVKVLAAGALVGGDTSVTSWRSATTVPSGVPSPGDAGVDGGAAAPMWMLGVDGMGRVMRVRNDYFLEAVGDRYGVGGMSVRAVGYAGNRWVGFWTDANIVATDGVTAMRYMNGPYTMFAAAGERFAGAAADRVEVLTPASGQLRTYRVAGATGLALTQSGSLVFAVGDTLWSQRSDGVVDAFFRLAAPVRAMVTTGTRVWFVAGSELGTVVGARVSVTQGLALASDARIAAGASDTLWVLRGATAPRLYRAMEVTLTPEQQWAEAVQPVFARRCGTGMCHGPPPMGRQTNLSTYAAWVSLCGEIRARTVDWRAGSASALMPLGGPALAGDERAAVDAWTRTRCPP